MLLSLALLALAFAACLGPSAQEKAEKDATYHYQLGDGAFRDRHIPEAIRELLLAVQLQPGLAEAHHLLGFIYMGRQEYDQALLHFQRAVELEPRFLEAQNNLGTVYLALCRWDEAAAVFGKLVADPLYQTPHIAQNNLGLALLHKGQTQEAVLHFQRAIFLSPTFCVAYNNLGMAQLELDQLDDAQRALVQATTADPSCKNYAEPYFHLGRLFERAGRLEQAQEQYKRCHELTRTSLPLGYGCGSTPLGPRCEQKLRQAGQLAPWTSPASGSGQPKP